MRTKYCAHITLIYFNQSVNFSLASSLLYATFFYIFRRNTFELNNRPSTAAIVLFRLKSCISTSLMFTYVNVFKSCLQGGNTASLCASFNTATEPFVIFTHSIACNQLYSKRKKTTLGQYFYPQSDTRMLFCSYHRYVYRRRRHHRRCHTDVDMPPPLHHCLHCFKRFQLDQA